MPARLSLVHVARYALLSASIAACGSNGAEPDQVAERLRATLPAVFDATTASIDTAGESTAVAGLSDSLDAMDASLGLPFSLSPFESDSAEPTLRSALDLDDELSGDELAERLIETIFTKANHEGGGVYILRGEDFCPADDSGAPDPECVSQWNRAELRIRVELVDGGLDFTFLVGPERAEPLLLELRRDRVTLAVDLGEAAEALRHIARITGEEIELPSRLEGVVAVSLVVHGPRDVSFELAVREAVAVEVDTDTGPISFSTDARDPLASVRLDGAARRIIALLDVGPTAIEMPWQDADSSSLASGAFALDLRGVSATVEARDGEDTITISDVGLGDATTTAKLDGHTLLAVDLNPDSGRRFAVQISPSAGGLPSVSFDPELDLALDFDLGPLAAAGDLVEDYLLDQAYRITFDGSSPSWQAIAPDELTGTPGALRIERGTLTIAASAAALPVVVNAGQCLVADPLLPEEHPILGGLAAANCP